MRRRAMRPAGVSVNITSLCDVMLSLLIFFMLVSKAGVDTGADRTLTLPLASLGVTHEDLQKEQQQGTTLVLNIDPDPEGIPENPRVYGRLFGSGTEFSHYVVNPRTQVPELRAFVQAVKGDRDDFVVAIHADAGMPFHDVQPVLQAVNAANPARVRFAFSPNR